MSVKSQNSFGMGSYEKKKNLIPSPILSRKNSTTASVDRMNKGRPTQWLYSPVQQSEDPTVRKSLQQKTGSIFSRPAIQTESSISGKCVLSRKSSSKDFLLKTSSNFKVSNFPTTSIKEAQPYQCSNNISKFDKTQQSPNSLSLSSRPAQERKPILATALTLSTTIETNSSGITKQTPTATPREGKLSDFAGPQKTTQQSGIHDLNRPLFTVTRHDDRRPSPATQPTDLQNIPIVVEAFTMGERSLPLKDRLSPKGNSSASGKMLGNKRLIQVNKSGQDFAQGIAAGDKQGLKDNIVKQIPQYFMSDLKAACRDMKEVEDIYEHDIVEGCPYRKFVLGAYGFLQRMKLDTVVFRPNRLDYARKYPDRKLLVLDLDETLIHCTEDPVKGRKLQMEVDFINDSKRLIKGYLSIRPHAKEFLRQMSAHFEVVVFTASQKYYADRIMKILDPEMAWVSRVFYRESCCKTALGLLVKDLTIFYPTPLEEILLVDNSAYCFWPQLDNGIPVTSYLGESGDAELQKLTPFLLFLKTVAEPRKFVKTYFQLHKFVHATELKSLLKSLDVLRHHRDAV